MTPKFIYFDLGKVLVDFSFERMYRQMGEAAGIEPRQVQAVLAAGWQADYETGRLDSRAAHEVFCRQTGTRPDYEAFSLACNDIFTPIDSMLPVVASFTRPAIAWAFFPTPAKATGTIACGVTPCFASFSRFTP